MGDEMKSYAVEGTPFQRSSATSLSSLLNFDDEEDDDVDDEDANSEDKHLLEACMNAGMPKSKPKPYVVLPLYFSDH
jgi:hypothetical protein